MPRALTGTVVLLLLAGFAGGCGSGGRSGGAQVRVQLTSYRPGRQPARQTRSFSLTCGSRPSGSLPFAARICRDISRHPQTMLNPGRARSVCAGGPFMPELTVRASANAAQTSFAGAPFCNWPGGTALGIYWAATQHNLEILARAEPRLRCDDDPRLLVRPTPWASVTACLHGRWTPRSERLIGIAERLPMIAALRPAKLFPRDIGAQRCTIAAGGPAPGRAFHGTCGVYVTKVWSTPRVAFVEDWPRGTSSRTWRHTWHVIIRKGRPVLVGQTGATTPQFWR